MVTGRHATRLAALGLGAVLAAAACSASVDVRASEVRAIPTTTTEPAPTTPTTPTPSTTAPGPSPTTAKGAKTGHVPADDPNRPSHDYDPVLDAAVADIAAFWRQQFPIVYGRPYEELKGGVWAMYPGVTGVPGCGRRQSTTYREIRGNAFYCRDADFIAYDDAQLFPEIDDQFGSFVLGMILAHEWGHSIQARAGVVNEATIVLEQQADCFAGSWMAHLRGTGTGALRLTDAEVNAAFGGMLTFSDAPGTTANDTQAHGSGFDRVGAFQDGFANGAKTCATYPEKPPTVIELPFGSAADAATNGNLSFAQIVPSAKTDLDRYWASVFQQRGATYRTLAGGLKPYPDAGPYPACAGVKNDAADYQARVFYCKAGDYVGYDQDTLSGPVYAVGDFAAAVLIGDAWSAAMQDRLGVTLSGKERSLQADCMTGSWTRAALPSAGLPADKLVLSPGDLDEALVSYLKFASTKDQSTADVGTTFERIASYRTGLLQGLSACGLR
jgi:predicted metalloprotease